MKKILTALTVLALAYSASPAQERVSNQVCRFSSKGVSCYKTKYAENFKVCKNDYGYGICGENATRANTTHPKMGYSVAQQPANEDMSGYNSYLALQDKPYPELNEAAQQNVTAPQSQSYPPNTGFGFSMITDGSYEGYYPKKNYIKVCYMGDNVALDNLNPYHGCPSPQFEGPAVNNERNINANNESYNLPPLTGRSEGE